ncbi:S-adenosylmethionine-dependent methyltransferase (N(5)-glutamine) [Schizosaccharomyces cryophilus OY26]|uniref:peptide chain release factor N(5)-glutamine methyltransferase n=1 Tax=Schizosaccharomyces cryophilus (strain OY26 / ATCC MYA-4695 / CBS 11777 / NBRC 106824 / NRRL Y48691) TaxID=653667 RepID=S9W5D5_SCHCR|nr:S-adenosylmethionine-dependent methyltransferase (N(5)-glutamine) [Schizosaccharomyces cryophilus OY26]EPY53145.1 S-adenosylmethionine-dependent methyltransferase (N(5)-glutamine) [Schizosaccharomyces cryophilus OY26]
MNPSFRMLLTIFLYEQSISLQLRNRFLADLYRATESIEQAKQEWKWICQELRELYPKDSKLHIQRKIIQACKLRGRKYPLQYILQTQPFGPLNIQCSPGVLIPRWETEEWVERTMPLLYSLLVPNPVRIMDLCSGSGCISSYISASFKRPHCLHIIDISSKALHVSAKNLLACKQDSSTLDTQFHKVNVLSAKKPMLNLLRNCHAVLCNPPYISPNEFYSNTDLSVRRYEPKHALIAQEDGNQFYKIIASYVFELLKDPLITKDALRLLVFEIGSSEQAKYVKNLFSGSTFHTTIWKDSANLDRTVVVQRT